MKEQYGHIIRKAVKLFALAENNPSVEEAQSAIIRARALLKKYNLTLTKDDLTQDEKSKIYEQEVDTKLRTHPQWVANLAAAIGNTFDAEVLCHYGFNAGSRGRSISFIGFEPDISLARHAFLYLFGTILRHKVKGVSAKAQNHWRLGFVYAVSARLRRYKQDLIDSDENSLLPIKDDLIKEYMQAEHGEVRIMPAKRLDIDISAYASGRKAGEKIPLFQPINQDEKTECLALH